MRSLILPLFLAASTSVVAADFIIVVKTKDRVVLDYFQGAQVSSAFPQYPFRTVVQTPGSVSYHVVGGVPPFREVDCSFPLDDTFSITLMDAEGTIATGRGTIKEQHIAIAVGGLNEQDAASEFVRVPTPELKKQQASAAQSRTTTHPTDRDPRPVGEKGTGTTVGPAPAPKPDPSRPSDGGVSRTTNERQGLKR